MRKRSFARAVLLSAAGAVLSGCASDGPRTEPSAARRADAGPLAAVAFLEGHWKGVCNDGTWEELWTSDEGGVMVCMSKQVVESACVFFEYSRIRTDKDGTVELLASPAGRCPPTSFPLARASNHGGTRAAVFELSDRDYPRVITYRRTDSGAGSRLEAILEGTENGVERRETLVLQSVR